MPRKPRTHTSTTILRCRIDGCTATTVSTTNTDPPLAPGWGHIPGMGYLCKLHAPMFFAGLRHPTP